MGRPPKIAPFSHYDEYKQADVEFFISLIVGREDLYNPCEEFNEERQRAFYFIEKKCSHFLAMRKGRNAEKLWLNLFNNFEKDYRNRTRSNSSSDQNGSQFPFYRYMEFLIPYIERIENQQKSNINTNALLLNLHANLNDNGVTSDQTTTKRPRIDTAAQEEWFLKVLETVAETQHQQQQQPTIREPSPPPLPSRSDPTNKEETSNTPIPDKYSDIITWIASYLDIVPSDKLMLSKVRLFQFIESEKQKMKDGVPLTL